MDKVPIFKFTGCFYGEWINFTFISAILMYKTASREKKRERAATPCRSSKSDLNTDVKKGYKTLVKSCVKKAIKTC